MDVNVDGLICMLASSLPYSQDPLQTWDQEQKSRERTWFPFSTLWVLVLNKYPLACKHIEAHKRRELLQEPPFSCRSFVSQ